MQYQIQSHVLTAIKWKQTWQRKEVGNLKNNLFTSDLFFTHLSVTLSAGVKRSKMEKNVCNSRIQKLFGWFWKNFFSKEDTFENNVMDAKLTLPAFL